MLCPQTTKYLQGLAGGKWIVSNEWLKQCVLRKELTSEVITRCHTYFYNISLSLQMSHIFLLYQFVIADVTHISIISVCHCRCHTYCYYISLSLQMSHIFLFYQFIIADVTHISIISVYHCRCHAYCY